MIDNQTTIVCSMAIKQGKLGAAMHNAAYAHLGLNYAYVPMTVTDLRGAIAGMRAFNFRGSAVSMPYKQPVMRYMDKIDPVAREIGAVNTISNKGGSLVGYNSDWIGAVAALKEAGPLKGMRAVLLGAGGAARAISYGLVKGGAEVTIFNRTPAKARLLARKFGLEFGGTISAAGACGDYDILINATPVGFYPETGISPLAAEDIRPGKIVMDVVFNPPHTPFMENARRRGCTVVPGYRMLIHQALFQFEEFTGRKAPFAVMERALRRALRG